MQPLNTIRQQVDLYHQTLEENGHPVPDDMVIVREFFCGKNRSEALEKARTGFAKKYEVYAGHGFQGNDEELTGKITGDLESLMDDTFIVGSPDECLEQIAEYRKLGFTDIALRLFYPEMTQDQVLEHIELVGRELIPELHKL